MCVCVGGVTFTTLDAEAVLFVLFYFFTKFALIYGDRRKKRRRRRKPCAPGAVKGGQNRQLNCQRRSRLLCQPQPSQDSPEKSRGGGGGGAKAGG